MDLGIKGKVALVTGGSRGLGRQSALALAAEGVSVAICARGEETLKQTAAELESTGVKVGAYVADLGDESGANDLVAKVEAELLEAILGIFSDEVSVKRRQHGP